jgi:hypothetical protein
MNSDVINLFLVGEKQQIAWLSFIILNGMFGCELALLFSISRQPNPLTRERGLHQPRAIEVWSDRPTPQIRVRRLHGFK